MSRAFVKDDDDRPEPEILSGDRPYYVLAEALETLDDERRPRAVVVEIVPGTVGFGSRVTVAGDDEDEATYELVNDEDADPIAGTIGMTSPLAEAMLGAHAGAEVIWQRPAGAARLRVTRIVP